MHRSVSDGIPWPALRDFLVMNPGTSKSQTLPMYAESFRFDWPLEEPVMIVRRGGGWSLHPEFETHVGNLENWRLEGPIVEAFPDVIHFLH